MANKLKVKAFYNKIKMKIKALARALLPAESLVYIKGYSKL